MIPIIDTIHALGDFPVVNANEVQCGSARLDVVLNSSAIELASKASKSYVDEQIKSAWEDKPKYTKAEVGLGNVDNTSDADKPVSVMQQMALDDKASVSSVVSVANRVTDLETEQTFISARVDSLSRLEEGSTTGDAELIDIRTDSNGKTYETAGNSVRGQISELASMINDCVSGAEIINDSNVESICMSNANGLPNNRIYSVGLNSIVTNFPYTKGIILTHGIISDQVHAGDFQIFVNENGIVKSRIYWASAWTPWKILTNEDYVRNREKLYMLGTETNISDSTSQSICGNDFDNLPNNRIYGMGITNASVSNIPGKLGTVVTFGKQESRTNGDFQIHINENGIIRTRRFWSNAWTAWKIDINEDYIKNREKYYVFGTDQNINDTTASSICSNDFNNLPNNRIFGVGIVNADVANIPGKLGNVRTYGKTDTRSSGDVQVFTSNGGVTYTRICWGGNWTEWSTETGTDIRVLALGDSICAGHRNNQKGFIGDAGVLYDNIGISGATISTKVTDVKNIPQQLVDYAATNQPDAIITNGGVNDYFFAAPLGTIPTVAVKSDSEAKSLDKSTILGGLQYLFWTMISKFPKAQRFFLCTHKTTAKASNTSSTIVDWTITKNAQNYTQTEEFEAIKTVCRLYNVSIIDIFNESQINTAFDAYKSDVPYSTDSSVTNTEFVDSDGIHPLAYGYKHGYAPYVKKAIDKVSKK